MLEVECYFFTFLKDIGKIACLKKTKYMIYFSRSRCVYIESMVQSCM